MLFLMRNPYKKFQNSSMNGSKVMFNTRNERTEDDSDITFLCPNDG